MADSVSTPKLYSMAMLAYYASLLSIVISIAAGLYGSFVRTYPGPEPIYPYIVLCVSFLVSLALGIYALVKLNTNGLRGRGLAITAIVISSLFLLLFMLAVFTNLGAKRLPP